jgi:hypothetical protein
METLLDQEVNDEEAYIRFTCIILGGHFARWV